MEISLGLGKNLNNPAQLKLFPYNVSPKSHNVIFCCALPEGQLHKLEVRYLIKVTESLILKKFGDQQILCEAMSPKTFRI